MTRRGLLLSLLLAGCAGVGAARHTALLAPNLRYHPPLPRALGRNVQAAQQIVARYREQTVAFEAYLGVTPSELTLVATDGFGRRALTLMWGDAGLQAQAAPFVPEFIRAENILADITVAYWPAAAVRDGLAGTGASVTDEVRRRVIAFEGQDIIAIDYEGAGGTGLPPFARYRNLAFGYELELRSAASE